MIRAVFAYILALALTITGFSFAQARGTTPDFGAGSTMQVVICAGVGLTTITIGPDGQPVKTSYICPDAASHVVADFTMPVMELPAQRLIARITPVTANPSLAQHALSPSARGPPGRV
ncbi:hypothetical protein [Aliiroseovarius sp.]|uniref:hypothetical protein n=1 Tax=Aliiroseovarius sp. TaxID=1872442 RepID=UPI0026248112|nr:hypothetical protein [Aliiroseovarius sp.]